MSVLTIRPADSCQYDLISLGEIMLRLDPGEGRIHTTRQFGVWESGGEYNVARGLRRCFGMRTAVVSAFADNSIGRLIEDLIMQGGVDTSFLRWVPYDGISLAVRLSGADDPAEECRQFIARQPMRRLGTADENAEGVLLRAHNAFCTGTILSIDGGQTT